MVSGYLIAKKRCPKIGANRECLGIGYSLEKDNPVAEDERVGHSSARIRV
jgi:hypothetical protein